MVLTFLEKTDSCLVLGGSVKELGWILFQISFVLMAIISVF